MCTVTVVPGASGFRLVCNRDELRTRPEAISPRLHRGPRVTAAWPIDTKSGGTWIAANDAGLAFALLNRSRRSTAIDARAPAPVSRGTIIPLLSDSTSLTEVMERASRIRLADIDPFTLVVVDESSIGTMTWVERRLSLRMAPLEQPVLFTSSSMGDDAVYVPRSELFEMMVRRSRDPFHSQAAFHRHCWPLRPEISVQMSRADASTVSRTVVDVRPDRFSFHYTPVRL